MCVLLLLSPGCDNCAFVGILIKVHLASNTSRCLPNPPLTHILSLLLPPLSRSLLLSIYRLGHLAHCLSTQLWLQREYGVSTEIMLQRQNANKWRRARNSVVGCFPTFRDWNFETEAFTNYFKMDRVADRKKWFGMEGDTLLNQFNAKGNPEMVEKSLAFFANLTAAAVQNETMSAANDNHTITMPYLHARAMLSTDFYVDKFYHDLREYMRFDSEKCCKLRADPDESVFVSSVPAIIDSLSYYVLPRSIQKSNSPSTLMYC